MKNLIIIGAGEAGIMIANEIIRNSRLSKKYNLIGFIDDNKEVKKVLNFDVLGSIDKAQSVIKKYNIDDVIIAIPSAKKELINRIMSYILNCDVRIKIVPGLSEIIDGDVKINQVRAFKPADLLGREEVNFDIFEISSYYKDKTIFVTGAGGSIGSEIVVQLLELPIKKVVIFGHGENSIHSLISKLEYNDRFEYVIGDVKDYPKLEYEISRLKPDVVFHAAAHKHVILMEECPDESLKNNVLGTYNITKAVVKNNISRLIFISTDKAVNPTSIMGATKRMGEKIILSFSMMKTNTKFSLVRFGNVLGSRGSVIPIFRSQIKKGGPITITHKEVTRFFMLIREAARLVIKSSTIEDGKIFVLDMGKPMKIVDLAKNMIKLYGYAEKEIPIIFTGLKKGEKLYEELLTESEHLKKTKYNKLFISKETQIGIKEKELEEMIKEVNDVASTYNKELIKKTIKKYVPEYLGETL